MVQANGVEVYLQRHSPPVRYEEHATPSKAMLSTRSANEKYIEAVTDERFCLVVKLLPDFDWMHQSQTMVKIDLGPQSFGTFIFRRYPKKSDKPEDHVSPPRSAVFDVSRRFINGQEMNCALTFGKLESGTSYHPGISISTS